MFQYLFYVILEIIIITCVVMRRKVEEEVEHGWIWFIFTTLQIQLVVKVKCTKLDIYTFKMHQKYFRAPFEF